MVATLGAPPSRRRVELQHDTPAGRQRSQIRPASENFHAACVKFSRDWIDSSGKFRKIERGIADAGNGTEMKLQLTTHGSRALTLTEWLVVICVIALLVAVLLPALAPPMRKSSKIGCVNNLKQVGLAFRIWEGDNGDKYPMQVSVTNGGAMELAAAGDISAFFRVMSNEVVTPKILACPADEQRTAALSFSQNFSDANISYFLSLDASDAYPQMMLCGDDNLVVNGVRVRPGILNLSTNILAGWTKERHNGAGNIALSDGSVQTSTRAAIQAAFQSAQKAFQSTGFATNHLVIP